ncbi:MAG TPA: hypothetical protein VGI10_10750 [Polyangiaceae bacterium]|jgi:hypothetical protein
MPVILVELPAADSGDPNVPALIRACSEGLHDGECALQEQHLSEPAAAVAIVSWLDNEHQRARLEVVSREDSHAAWHTRELGFHEQDAAVERWRALGFAIASLVGEALPSSPAPRVEVSAPTPSPAPRSHSAARPLKLWHTAIGAQLSRGLSAGAPSAGLWLGLARHCCGDSGLEVLARAGESWSSASAHGISARFTTIGLGFGMELVPLRELALDASLLGVLDALHVEADSPSTGTTASAHRNLLGAALGLDAVWPRESTVAASLGGELLALSGATGIHLFNQEAAESPALRWGFRAGLHFRF